MAKNNFFFFFSGVIALFIYFCILFAFVFDFSKPTRYAVKSDTQIEQSIAIDAIIESSAGEDKTQGGSPLEGTGVKDLFSDVSEHQEDSDKIADNREELARNLELNKKRKKAIDELQSSIKNINTQLQDIKNQTIEIKPQDSHINTTDGIYDEWMSKIQKILFSKWNPPTRFDNKTGLVSVDIKITQDGSFSYVILKKSPYQDYNESVKNLLDYFVNQKFPPYPKDKSIVINVNFRIQPQRN